MLTSVTGHDCVLLHVDDPLIDIYYITSLTGMTDKQFYKLISKDHFPKPIKLGRGSRQCENEVEQWIRQRIEESRGAAAWDVLQYQRWYCGGQPCPWCWRHYRSSPC